MNEPKWRPMPFKEFIASSLATREIVEDILQAMRKVDKNVLRMTDHKLMANLIEHADTGHKKYSLINGTWIYNMKCKVPELILQTYTNVNRGHITIPSELDNFEFRHAAMHAASEKCVSNFLNQCKHSCKHLNYTEEQIRELTIIAINVNPKLPLDYGYAMGDDMKLIAIKKSRSPWLLHKLRFKDKQTLLEAQMIVAENMANKRDLYVDEFSEFIRIMPNEHRHLNSMIRTWIENTEEKNGQKRNADAVGTSSRSQDG